MHNRRLTLHIGSHKTGTSSIQRGLYANSSLLADHGISLFTTDIRGQETHKGQNSWTKFDREGLVNSTISDQLAEKLGQTGTHVLFSAETLSWIFDPRKIRAFHRQLRRHFAHIQVIVYLRRQDQQAVSHYQQASKSSKGANRFYGDDAVALPQAREHFANYYDYELRVGRWADVFGDENMVIRVFEKDQLHHQDAVSDFFKILGIEFGESRLRNKESSGYEMTKIGHLMNQAGVAIQLRKKIFRYLDDSGKLLPTRQEAWNFYETYRESNRRLNQRFRINQRPFLFQEDFSGYPEEPTEQWTEDGANRAISNLLRAIKDIPLLTDHEISVLLNRADKLYATDPASAAKLAGIAAKGRPQNENIRALTERYSNPPAWHRLVLKLRETGRKLFVKAG